MDDQILLGEVSAGALTEQIGDRVVRNLLRFAVAEARTQVVRRADESEQQWRARLPREPFDMMFFVTVLGSMFAKSDIIARIQRGQDIAEASEWQI